MNIFARWKVATAGLVTACAALALTACIVAPGKFESTFDVRRDGSFTFTYDGEIHLLALSRLAEMANEAEAGAGDFVETPCHDDESFEERPCTEAEIAEQRESWELQAETRKQQAQQEAEQMARFLGGIDPADPEAAEELAARLRRQEGWRRVEYRGDGLFEVEFSLSSRLGHDFVFPILERFPMSNSFVIANLRQGNSVRIEAPGFADPDAGDPIQAMAAASAASTFPGAAEAQAPPFPEMEGTFRVVTDGRILANNTDEGPVSGPGGQVLEWKVNRRTQSAPMALIQLGD